MMITLRKAISEGKLDEFIAEWGAAPEGDEAAFNRAVASMAQTSKAAPAASKKASRDC
jgi:hypothetical protein